MKTLVMILLLTLSAFSQSFVVGRITDNTGRGIPRAEVQAFAGECSFGWVGTLRTTTTSFGYYYLGLPSGCSLVAVTVQSKQYRKSFPGNYVFQFEEFGAANFVLIR